MPAMIRASTESPDPRGGAAGEAGFAGTLVNPTAGATAVGATGATGAPSAAETPGAGDVLTAGTTRGTGVAATTSVGATGDGRGMADGAAAIAVEATDGETAAASLPPATALGGSASTIERVGDVRETTPTGATGPPGVLAAETAAAPEACPVAGATDATGGRTTPGTTGNVMAAPCATLGSMDAAMAGAGVGKAVATRAGVWTGATVAGVAGMTGTTPAPVATPLTSGAAGRIDGVVPAIAVPATGPDDAGVGCTAGRDTTVAIGPDMGASAATCTPSATGRCVAVVDGCGAGLPATAALAAAATCFARSRSRRDWRRSGFAGAAAAT